MFYQLGIVSLFSRIAYCRLHVKHHDYWKNMYVFRSSLAQIFFCFLYATCDDIVLSCLNLVNNLGFFMIVFLGFLFTNAAWSHPTWPLLMVHVYQKHTGQYNRNWINMFGLNVYDSNSFRISFINRLLSNFFDYLWFLFLKVSFQVSKIWFMEIVWVLKTFWRICQNKINTSLLFEAWFLKFVGSLIRFFRLYVAQTQR